MEFSISEIAQLANLRLTQEEEEELRSDLESFLRLAAQMKEPGNREQEAELPPVLREDRVFSSLTREETLRNAPESRDGFFVLPRAIGGESHA